MPIHLTDEEANGISVVEVTGTLQKSDYPPFVSEFEQLMKRHGKLRLLFDMSELKGWRPGAIWPELKFDIQHLSQIERLAAVGNKDWEHRMVEFTKHFTSATIRYFDTTKANAAREWLGELQHSKSGASGSSY